MIARIAATSPDLRVHVMNMGQFIFAIFLVALSDNSMSNSQTNKSIGPELRKALIELTPAKAGIVATSEFPHVYGVALDWPIGENIATVISLWDGSASLYSTSTFGIIGGAEHESVRRAAKRFVHEAERYLADSTPASAYPYPAAGKVSFYILTYDGVREIMADEKAIYSGTDKFSTLFGAGQDVVTELRAVTEKK